MMKVPRRQSQLSMQSGANLTRRSLMQSGIGFAAAAALPRDAGAAAEEISPVMGKLSAYMSEARSRAIPDAVAQETKYHILDTLAAMISGSQLPPGRQALRFAHAYGGAKLEAAIVNGALAQSDETDDNYSAGGAHPGCAVVPAALALGETFGIDGTHFLRAVTLGYDIGMRAMKTVLGRTVLKDTHNVVGTFGASAAGGCVASLNAEQMRWLLDYAAQQAGAGFAVWQRDPEHMEKAFMFGSMGARNGVTAALLIQSGWTGVSDVLSGPDNFFQSYAPQANPSGLIDQLGERYEVTQTIIKKWSTGGPIQSPLDALVNLRRQRPFEAEQVKRVVVRLSTSAAPKVDNNQNPDLCLQYLVAVMLLDRTVSFRAAHDKVRMQDPAIQRERAKVDVVAEEELERLLPKRVAIVEVTLTDGTQLREYNDTVRGTPENPMSQDEVVVKARDLVTPVLGAATCSKLIEKIFQLDRVPDIRELRPLLQP
jgi:2-methylcitrate dehydratase PrpD